MKIWRGGSDREPMTVNKPVSGTLLPGTIVTEGATQLTQLTDPGNSEALVLSNREFYDQDTATAYANGDTGVAYIPLPGDVFKCALAAGTYVLGAALTVAASGRLAAAATGDRVVAFYQGTSGATLTAGDLADVRWANSFVAD